MPKFIFYGNVEADGFLTFEYPGIFFKRKMELKGKMFALTLEEAIDTKSSSQLALYIGIIIKKYCLNDIQFGGHEQDEIIDYFLDRTFGEDREIRIKGRSIVKRMHPTLSSLNKKEMNHLINNTMMILSLEFGIVVEEKNQFKNL